MHTEFHRPVDKAIPDRYSRHYADTAALAAESAVSDALANQELRDRVIQWKSRFFGSSWAQYESARPGTFHLVPPLARWPAIRRDYQAMRDMYLSEPIPFEELLRILHELEFRINQTGE